jgi:hypothetical protein
MADGGGRGRCGALGGWGSVGVRFSRGVRADFHRPEPDEGPALHPGHPGDWGAVLGQLAAGLTIPELLVDFQYVDWVDVLAALEFAATAVQERGLPLAQWAQPPRV